MNSNLDVNDIIEELTRAFWEKKENMVNLKILREYVSKDKNAEDANIFKYKLEQLGNRQFISKEEFRRRMESNIEDEEEFNLIFDKIDGDKSGMISKKQLQELNKSQNLGLTEGDIDVMVNFVSKDKQKVRQKDLYEFLKN